MIEIKAPVSRGHINQTGNSESIEIIDIPGQIGGVPNSELISNGVINWTLAKYSRRLILTIYTHQDADIDLVLKIMKEAVSNVEFVLKEPEVKSYFHGIKDNQLEFALFYWASGNILDCKSLVNQRVQKALKDAGIDFVMPLHVIMQDGKKPE